ncbi:hypothetical protein MHK03_12500 [Corynebacterium simulans]|uniref:hypothetical protein n=1 Tax=Corynebacterium simulans TaxID=146827 RepID=UPI001EF2DC34|nr:hypothetical protein [Corynebacterium simulans]MCG7248717.1 hypothetical protein [Corynebacterium simulans]
MKDKLPLLETVMGIVCGIVALYGGILLSTTLPIPFVLYGLPLALLLACGIILFFIFLVKKNRYISNCSWKAFIVALILSFSISSTLWITTIVPYANFS